MKGYSRAVSPGSLLFSTFVSSFARAERVCLFSKHHVGWWLCAGTTELFASVKDAARAFGGTDHHYFYLCNTDNLSDAMSTLSD